MDKLEIIKLKIKDKLELMNMAYKASKGEHLYRMEYLNKSKGLNMALSIIESTKEINTKP